MCNLCGVGSVVHEEEVDVFGVVDEESSVAGRHHVSCLFVRAETDLELNHCQLLCCRVFRVPGLIIRQVRFLESFDFRDLHHNFQRTDGMTA